MMKHTIWLISLGICASAFALDDRFATDVVAFGGLGNGFYSDPSAALGKPTTWIKDTSVNGGPDQRIACSIGYPAWNVSPSNSPLVVTIPSGGFLTLKFRSPVINDRRNWYGYDFIVFGNALVPCQQPITWLTDPDSAFVANGPDFLESVRVSVSPDLIQWYTYPTSPQTTADQLWPTQAFRLGATGGWQQESDWQRPVSPALQRSQLSGLSLRQAVQLFEGSGGGTAFDLQPTGFSYIQYIRFEGQGGEIDAVSRVRPRPFPASPSRIP